MSRLKILLAIVCIVAFASMSHLALATRDAHGVLPQIAVFMLTLPVLAIGCWHCMNLLVRAGVMPSLRLPSFLLLTGAGLYGVLMLLPVMLSHLKYMYLAEHVSTNMMLCWLFAHTLFGGRTPLVTTFARVTHSELPEKILCYTRHVTQAWAIFFLLQVLLSLLIFSLASIASWSWFANVMNWPLVVLMFAMEYICRKRMNPDFPHSTIQQSVMAYFDSRRKI